MSVESIQAGKQLPNWAKRAVDSMSSVINTVPGMVLGIAFLFAFSGSSLQNTFLDPHHREHRATTSPRRTR